MHKLYVVNVSAGHAEDVTLRARRVLREARLIVVGGRATAAGEWRAWTGETPVLVRGGRDDAEVARIVCEALRAGDVAWVSVRAGPIIEGRGALSAIMAAGVEVLPVPGPWDLIACLAVSGLPADRFSFEGELPAGAAACRAAFEAAGAARQTLIWRLPVEGAAAALREAEAVLGQRRCVICPPAGEGAVWRGRLGEAMPPLAGGGYLIVEGSGEAPAWPAERVRDRVRRMLVRGTSVRETARAVAGLSRWRRKQVYQLAVRERAALDQETGAGDAPA